MVFGTIPEYRSLPSGTSVQLRRNPLQERVSREWTELFRDVEAALGEDPMSAKAQALADRWMKLVEEFTGGDPGITAGVGNLYRDRTNWPGPFQQQMAPFSNKQVWAFMQQALGARK